VTTPRTTNRELEAILGVPMHIIVSVPRILAWARGIDAERGIGTACSGCACVVATYINQGYRNGPSAEVVPGTAPHGGVVHFIHAGQYCGSRPLSPAVNDLAKWFDSAFHRGGVTAGRFLAAWSERVKDTPPQTDAAGGDAPARGECIAGLSEMSVS
jgi:hypothetical protein